MADFYTTYVGDPAGCTNSYGSSGCGESADNPKIFDESAWATAVALMSWGDTAYFKAGGEYQFGEDTPGSRARSLSVGPSTGGDWITNFITFGSFGTGARPVLKGGDDLSEKTWVADGDDWYWDASVYSTDWSNIIMLWVEDKPLRLMDIDGSEPIDGNRQWGKDTVNNRVYIRMPDGSDPNDAVAGEITLGIHGSIFLFNTRTHRQFIGVEFKYYGGGGAATTSNNARFTDCKFNVAKTGFKPSSFDVIIQDSEFDMCWNGGLYNSGDITGDGGGILLTTSAADNFIFRRNYIKNCYLGFIWAGVSALDGGDVSFNTFDRTHVNVIDAISGVDGTSTDPINVYNNTIIHYPDPEGVNGDSGGHAFKAGVNSYFNFVNNSILLTTEEDVCAEAGGCDNTQCVIVSTSFAGHIDYNSYYVQNIDPGDDGFDDYHYAQIDGGGKYDVLADWQTALDTFTSATGNDENSIFIAEGKYTIAETTAGDYSTLEQVTENVDAGDNSIWSGIPNITDIDGTPITDGSGNIVALGSIVNIGVLEYTGEPIETVRAPLTYSGRAKYNLTVDGDDRAFPLVPDLYAVDQLMGGDVFYDSADSNAPFSRTMLEWYPLLNDDYAWTGPNGTAVYSTDQSANADEIQQELGEY